MSKRTRIGKRYVTRTKDGQFKTNVDVGRSLSADRRIKSKNTVKAGRGHQGDIKRAEGGCSCGANSSMGGKTFAACGCGSKKKAETFEADKMMMDIMSKCPKCQSKNMEHLVTDYCQDCEATFNGASESFNALDMELDRNDCCELWVEKMYDNGRIGFGEASNLLASIEMDGLKCSSLGSSNCSKENMGAESQGLSKPARTAIGLTALGVGIALWKSEWINKLFEGK